MTLDLGSSIEFIRVTAEYSNAVMVAIMPYVSDFSAKLELPVPHPITVEHVESCGVLPWRKNTGEIGGGSINLKSGWSFSYQFGHVESFSSPTCFYGLQDPDQIPKFYGKVKMTEGEAVGLARSTIQKLGVPLEAVFAEQPPKVTSPITIGTNVVPRYRVEWFGPFGGPVGSVTMEINAEARRVESLSLRGKALEKTPPKVPIPLPHDPSPFGSNPPRVNPAYAEKLLPIILVAVSNYSQKLDLPVRQLTTNQLARFFLDDNGGWPHTELELTNGWRFIYRNSMVNGHYAPDNLFNSDNRPIFIRQFTGKWNMTEAEAIELIRRTLAKLNYPTNLVHMDFKPQVSKPSMSGIPRYFFSWHYQNAAGTDLQSKVEAEVDADKQQVKSLYYDDVSYWNHPPPIDEPISLK